MDVLVSVVIPLYNHGRFVEATLQSIVGQDYPRIELLVLDDGSTDDSVARAESFLADHAQRFERVRVWSQPNAGVTKTLNRLLDNALGEIAMPIASDDVLLPGAIRYRVETLARVPHALALFTDCIVIDEKGAHLLESGIRDLYGGNPAAFATNKGLAVSLLMHWCVPGGVLSMRRSAFAGEAPEGRMDEALQVEDFDLYVRLALTGHFLFDARPTSGYRVHSEQAIHMSEPIVVAEKEYILNKAKGRARGFAKLYLTGLSARHRLLHLPRLHPKRVAVSALVRAVERVHVMRIGHPPRKTGLDPLPGAKVLNRFRIQALQ